MNTYKAWSISSGRTGIPIESDVDSPFNFDGHGSTARGRACATHGKQDLSFLIGEIEQEPNAVMALVSASRRRQRR